MRSTQQILVEIEAKLGFVPPFFSPAYETPAVLENLWNQTLTSYLDNPIPDLFKEKLAALLSRYCSVPYCLMCHSSALRPLGMTPAAVLELLQSTPLDYADLQEKIGAISQRKLSEWPAAHSDTENVILNCCIAVHLNQDSEDCQSQLREILDTNLYNFLILFLSYCRSALTWAEAHPELNYQDDGRVQENLAHLVEAEPAISNFFNNYHHKNLEQFDRKSYWLSQENRRILETERKRIFSYFAQAPIGFAVVKEPAHVFVMANEYYEKLVGTTDITGKNMRQVRLGDDNDVFLSALDVAYGEGKGFVETEKPVWADIDGSGHPKEIYVSITVEPYRNEFNKIAGLLILVNDVTDQVRVKQEIETQKQREVELHRIAEEARHRLNDFFDQAPIPMCILEGEEHVFTLANPMYKDFVGREVVGKSVIEVFTSDEVHSFIPLLDRVYQTGEAYVGRELPFDFVGPDGTVEKHWIDLKYCAHRGEDGKIKGILAIVLDVTSHVEARQIIEESEKHFHDVANAMPQMVFTATPDGRINWHNQWWDDYLQYYYDGRIDDLKTPIHPDDVGHATTRWEQSLISGEKFTTEYRLKRGSDGAYRWHLGLGVPIKDDDGNVIKWIGSNTDIHDQRTLVQSLQEERELRDKFVASLTHDMRTPMSAAKMAGQLIGMMIDKPEKIADLANRVVVNMDRADSMIRNLLDANSIKAGEGIPIHLEECNAGQLIENLVNDLRSLYGPRFEFKNFSPDTVCRWDPSSIHRVVENLASNAVKYGDADSIITIALKRSNDTIEIAVHNFGDVISHADQKTLFNAYRRSDSAKSSAQKGWGIGLMLVRGVVGAHGGDTKVESSLQGGTTFTVMLPINGGRTNADAHT